MFCCKIGAEGSVLQELRHLVINPPPTKRRIRGVYCYQLVRDSEIPSSIFEGFALYNFISSCPILFKFSPHLNHQTLHVKPLSHCHEFAHDVRRVSASYNSPHIATIVHELCHKDLVKIVLRVPYDMSTIFMTKYK